MYLILLIFPKYIYMLFWYKQVGLKSLVCIWFKYDYIRLIFPKNHVRYRRLYTVHNLPHLGLSWRNNVQARAFWRNGSYAPEAGICKLNTIHISWKIDLKKGKRRYIYIVCDVYTHTVIVILGSSGTEAGWTGEHRRDARTSGPAAPGSSKNTANSANSYCS